MTLKLSNDLIDDSNPYGFSWKMPLDLANNDLGRVYGSNAVDEAVLNILSTLTGECPGAEDMGINMEEAMFGNPGVVGDVLPLKIVEAIRKHEPRVSGVRARTKFDAEAALLTIEVSYRDRGTGFENAVRFERPTGQKGLCMSNASDLSLGRTSPVISYTSLDAESIEADVESYLQQLASAAGDPPIDFNDGSLAKFITRVSGYLGDLLGYHINATVRELFGSTLKRRESLIRLGKPFGYSPAPPTSAIVTLRLTLNPAADYPFTITPSSQFSTAGGNRVYYQPTGTTQVLSYPVAGYVDVEAIEGELYESALVGISSGAAGAKVPITFRGVVVDSISVTVGAQAWTRVSTFINSEATDTDYRVVFDDLGNVFLYFGDGVNGAVPPASAQIRATYRVGGGRRGRVLRGTVTSIVSAPDAITAVTNPDDSTEGEDAQPLRTARYGLASMIAFQDTAVEELGYAALAIAAAPNSVSKARCRLVGLNQARIVIAPNGGGQPSDALRNQVLSYLAAGRSGLGQDPRVFGPTYRDVRLYVNLYVSDDFRAETVQAATQRGLINVDGTGLLDFAQLDFAALTQENHKTQLLLSATRLQSYFASLKSQGLDRAEITRMDAIPVGTPRDGGNTGNGTVELYAGDDYQPRTLTITMTSPTSFTVSESVTGVVSSITDTKLFDPSTDFAALGVDDTWVLYPTSDGSSFVAVVSAGVGVVEVGSGLGTLYAHTRPKSMYRLEAPSLITGTTGGPVVVGGVSITVNPGTTPFQAGDTFSVDLYPRVGDLVLHPEEYPRVLPENLVLRTIGGARSLPMQQTFISVEGETAGNVFIDSPSSPLGAYILEDTLGDTLDLASRVWEIYSVDAAYLDNPPSLSSASAVSTSLTDPTYSDIRGQRSTSTSFLVKCTRTLTNGTKVYDVAVIIIPSVSGLIVPPPKLAPWMLRGVPAKTTERGWAGGENQDLDGNGLDLLNPILHNAVYHAKLATFAGPILIRKTDALPRLIGTIPGETPSGFNYVGFCLTFTMHGTGPLRIRIRDNGNTIVNEQVLSTGQSTIYSTSYQVDAVSPQYGIPKRVQAMMDSSAAAGSFCLIDRVDVFYGVCSR